MWWLTVVDVVAPGGSCSGSRLSSALASAPPRSRGLSRPLLLLLQPPLSLASIIPVVFSLVERLPEGFCRTQLATSAQQQKAVRRGQASKLRARIQAMAKRFQCSAYSAAGGVIATPSWNGEWRKGWARACPLAFLRRDTRPEMIWHGDQIVSVLAGDPPASTCVPTQMAICAGGRLTHQHNSFNK